MTTPAEDRATLTRDLARGPSFLTILVVQDGLEALRQIRSEPRFGGPLVVMLTSSHEEKDIVESYRPGVDAYMVKPVDFSEFMEAVRRLGLSWAVLNETPPGPLRRAS